MKSALEFCPNCELPAAGDYCSKCGEYLPEARDLSLKSFVKDATKEFVSVDSKLLGSLKLLLRWPGRLTSEYLLGRRSKYLKPLQLFLIVNVFYFLFLNITHSNTFNTPLEVQYSHQVYSPLIRPIVDHALATKPLSFNNVAMLYDQVTGDYAKSLILLMVPLFALLMAVVLIW